ncbi:two-component system, chemotaxis family, sensor kinase CheA [Ruminococcaceae bacterium FB2012]|nr:two-component system, chemotaxis family, sensor kinase CheA [Ruminococcaceae bacterium FB2012]
MSKFDAGMESMLDTFVFESTELLENLDEILMRTENSELGPDDIAEIFRVMHTIKGSSAMMGLKNMSELAHAVEDIYFVIRENPELECDKAQLYELSFTTSDYLKNEIENLNDDSVPLTDFSEFIQRLHGFAKYLTDLSKGEAAAPPSAGKALEIFAPDEPDELRTVKIGFSESCMMPSIRAMVLMNSVGAEAEVVSTIPADLESDSADDDIKANGFYIKLLCDDMDKVLSVLKDGVDVESAEEVKRQASAAPAAEKKAPALPAGSAEEGVSTYLVRFEEGCLMPAIRAMVLVNSLAKEGELVRTVPDNLEKDEAEEEIVKNGFRIEIKAKDPDGVLAILKDGLNVLTADKLEPPKAQAAEEKTEAAAPAAQAAPAKAAPGAPKKDAGAHGGGSIISVKLEKLDRLLDLVAEIVITESGVTSSPDLKEFSGSLDRFQKSARELKKLTDELQDVVMSIRMVPVQTAFQKMSRVVRDMNKTLGKNVNLVFVGAETEADKSVVDILGDPLMHIVRNAVDHGIETPEERAAAGKTEPATVTLSAGYESGEVVISCEDNGAGMDPKKLLAKARKNGILTKPESEYTDAECYQLIMTAGFSTNETVTEYSGRGVGMDVVRKNIETVGGKMSIDSELGRGSKFTIRIPLSLSIIDVLDVKANGAELSVPVSSVREIFRVEPGQLITDPGGTELVMVREKCLRVIRLADAFELEGERIPLTEGIMLYCAEGDREAVIFADELTSDQQVVVKPLSILLNKYDLKKKGIAGCSILADGSITLITDINELMIYNGVKSRAELG